MAALHFYNCWNVYFHLCFSFCGEPKGTEEKNPLSRLTSVQDLCVTGDEEESYLTEQ